MAGAQEALELLCATDTSEAADRARRLDALNSERRNEEERILEEALAQAELQVKNAGLVVAGDSWNPGVIGIVASRIVEAHYRPTLVLCRDGDAYKGSGRSIHEFDLYAGLTECADILDSFGGHRMAAGLRVRPERLEEFRQRFNEAVLSQLGEELPSPIADTGWRTGLCRRLRSHLSERAGADGAVWNRKSRAGIFFTAAAHPSTQSFRSARKIMSSWSCMTKARQNTYAKAWRQADQSAFQSGGQRVVWHTVPSHRQV